MRPVSLSFFQDWTRLVRMYLSQGSPRRSYRQWLGTPPSALLAPPVHPRPPPTPNPAVTGSAGMTFITSRNATPEQIQSMTSLFESLGMVMEIPEKQFDGGMALASCGIAYALRYVRAAMEGGIELGIPPRMAQTILAQTLKGAAEILLRTGNHPEIEIDKVTTPGGITISGLNAMEATGFTHAVFEGL